MARLTNRSTYKKFKYPKCRNKSYLKPWRILKSCGSKALYDKKANQNKIN